ncbi:hypothetical protein KDL01_28175 [Actinospica durhamensis]|uniref:Uncharacterized protein n=1 Tax=Actinospica durhamensis TaxID=1508375 RepID=A0A941EVL1_9ACTN|nr:hypothetical protein [Actinospica durhamensis]MBR7837187.1 hypothetical protein [Actinospica durhamensis]
MSGDSVELVEALDRLSRTTEGLATMLVMLETEIPLYGLGSVLLALASVADGVRVQAMEAWAAALRVSGEAQMAAGLPDPKLLAYVSGLLGLGGVAGRSEAQAVQAVGSGRRVVLELDGEAAGILRDLVEASDQSGAAVAAVAGSESETAMAAATLNALTGAATVRDAASALYVALTEPGGGA